MVNPVAGLVGCIVYALTLIYLVVVLCLPGPVRMSWKWAYLDMVLALTIASHALHIPDGTFRQERVSNGLTTIAVVCLVYAWLQFLTDFQYHYFGQPGVAALEQDGGQPPASAAGGNGASSATGDGQNRTTAAAAFNVCCRDRTHLTSCRSIPASVLIVTQVLTVVAFIGLWYYSVAAFVLGIIAAVCITLMSLYISALVIVTAIKVKRAQTEQHVPTNRPTYLALVIACIPAVVISSASAFVEVFDYRMAYYYINLVAVLVASLLLISTAIPARRNDYGAGAVQLSSQTPMQVRNKSLRSSPSSSGAEAGNGRTSTSSVSGGDASLKLDVERYYGDEGMDPTDFVKYDRASHDDH